MNANKVVMMDGTITLAKLSAAATVVKPLLVIAFEVIGMVVINGHALTF